MERTGHWPVTVVAAVNRRPQLSLSNHHNIGVSGRRPGITGIKLVSSSPDSIVVKRIMVLVLVRKCDAFFHMDAFGSIALSECFRFRPSVHMPLQPEAMTISGQEA